MDSFDLDLFVIGGGSGGVRAARIAASEGGAKVALAEESRMGGTCVIRGCVPKKILVNASAFPGIISDAAAYGWEASVGVFDWGRFQTLLTAELTRLENAYRGTLKGAGVTIHDQRATVIDPHRVRLADGTEITTRHILVATGGRPFVPAIPGAELVLTSNEMFHLPALPARAIIMGGGFIACEFACILRGFGVDVTLMCRADQILRGFDDEARTHVANGMAEKGIRILHHTEIARVEAEGAGRRVTTAAGAVHEADLVLYATGRVPNAEGLGLEGLGVQFGPRRQILVDAHSQTAVPSIFAVGDVTDRIALTPVAIREGHAFADTVFGTRPWVADHELVASAVFTQPELGTVGLSEEDAMARGPCEIYAASFRPMKTLFAGRQDRTLMKLVVDSATRRVLGCHIVGPEAGEMIQLAAVAIRMGATKEDFDRTVAVHPTAAEELVTMRKPARIHG